MCIHRHGQRLRRADLEVRWMKGGKVCFWEFVDISKASQPRSAQKWHGITSPLLFFASLFVLAFTPLCPALCLHFLGLVRYWLCSDGRIWNNETISTPEPLGTINLHKFLLPIFCYFDVNGNETASASIALECAQLMQLDVLNCFPRCGGCLCTKPHPASWK